ncbi:hypothetical protein ACP70R_047747 [Stipagrostis hirtigluma subsp. patula]
MVKRSRWRAPVQDRRPPRIRSSATRRSDDRPSCDLDARAPAAHGRHARRRRCTPPPGLRPPLARGPPRPFSRGAAVCATSTAPAPETAASHGFPLRRRGALGTGGEPAEEDSVAAEAGRLRRSPSRSRRIGWGEVGEPANPGAEWLDAGEGDGGRGRVPWGWVEAPDRAGKLRRSRRRLGGRNSGG